MLYAVLWSAALAATAQLPRQAAASSLLLLSFFWTLQTIKAVVHATVAGTAASRYVLLLGSPPILSQWMNRHRRVVVLSLAARAALADQASPPPRGDDFVRLALPRRAPRVLAADHARPLARRVAPRALRRRSAVGPASARSAEHGPLPLRVES